MGTMYVLCMCTVCREGTGFDGVLRVRGRGIGVEASWIVGDNTNTKTEGFRGI